MIATQPDNIRAQCSQRRPIIGVAAQNEIVLSRIGDTVIQERHLIADVRYVGSGEDVGDHLRRIVIALLIHPDGGDARHGGDAGHDQLRQSSRVAIGVRLHHILHQGAHCAGAGALNG